MKGFVMKSSVPKGFIRFTARGFLVCALATATCPAYPENTNGIVRELLALRAGGPAGKTSEIPSVGWEKLTDQAAFSPRDTAEGLVFDGKMWLSNGYYPGNILTRDLWSSTNGVDWTLVNPNTPYDGYSEMVVYDGRMWAIKGTVWNSTNGQDWDCVSSQTPFGVRGYGEVVLHDGKMWQLGSGEDVWSTSDGKEWQLITAAAPFGKRVASSVAAFGGKLWLMGGYVAQPNDPPEKGYPQFTTCNDVWCSTNGSDWERVMEHGPWTPRMWAIAETYRDELWLIGGYDNRNGRNFDEVWHSSDGSSWRECKSETRFSPRHEPTCLVYQDSLWMIAGNTWPVLNDVWRLTLPASEK
jgi:hypothetical protein